MKALVWHGRNDVRIDNVPDPKIKEPTDVILKITSTAICGSDLHIVDGIVPTMEKGDILGHEFMGEVVEAGREVKKFKVGDRVVVPFTIACGNCEYCDDTLYSLCDNSNPNPEKAKANLGHSISGIFGYSHMLGGFDGGQAEYVRVPYADVGPIKVPSTLSDDQSLFLSDIFPTGYMAAENADIKRGDTVAIWGCGPVGQFAIQSAFMLGAERVIAIDSVKERLDMAKQHSRVELIRTTDRDDVYEKLMEMTNGKGPDSCIDAVGAEAHGDTFIGKAVDKTKEVLQLPMSRPYVLQQIMMSCKKAGTVSIPGVYIGMVNEIPFGAAMNKALTFKMGQTHVQRYLKPLLDKIDEGLIDPGFIITHRMKLDEAPKAYDLFKKKEDNCVKVVLTP
ncbi:zinc-dependent alcohol dehydrogenase [Salegentibacter salegens]|uniref:Threonine dehydrogenase n=1 Tax=Salegentibacter salegens TaxID=143223 RepID=A0A1M7KRF6_9FLAO|nr:zinc-dependent alcohol dehydrogenase [Salegentibacter salegens]PRX48846.1 threonine dehydrogenase-like Zn-dependent dehydrogenase [Salegentibacter salegens]SHM67757.1 Threonine dehydrogenase [Salegentibacter salegens]